MFRLRIPPVNERMKKRHISHALSFADDRKIKSPDFYIIHEFGVASFYLAALLCVSAYLLCLADYLYGYDFYLVPSIMDDFTILDKFNYLVSWCGRLTLLMCPMYFYKYYILIDTKKYDLFRFRVREFAPGESPILLFLLNFAISIVMACFLGSAYSSVQIYDSLSSLDESLIFVTFLAVCSVFIIQISAQLCLFSVISVFFIFSKGEGNK